ncbi:hypothetical protein G3480_18880 [Thiorhodococcus mannitoliphagus]|uniref:Uncharacterized protein n=1 Tax=Thiorhodococcus mannitoliphagus TaxID=329406 RepID=A0A6P1E2U8_9GAMM|nr:hypothetical protein [Thiorhodococcus mannitoliphagus]NEX22344.1 hypothetical protein [Thiorhodococcus mannitoliphagus]
MKSTHKINGWLAAAFALFAMPAAVTSPLAAEWSCIHASGGQIEYEDRIATTDRTHLGWGLDFEQSPGLYNWVHFAIPWTHGKTARFDALQFETGSVDAYVDQVHVYNLGERVKVFSDLDWSGNLQTRALDLGDNLTFSTLGISVGIAAGVEMMDHNFVFTGACAYSE